ncbi:MAG: ABC transporter substrate-binding protein [Negativibacillus sp.]
MKKNLTKALALALAATMVLAACSNTSKAEEKPAESNTSAETSQPAEPEKEEKVEEITDLVLARLATRELDTFNYLYSQSASNGENLTAMWEGLLQTNKKSQYLPCIAEEYGTEDGGLNWTFKIRDGVKWVDVNGNIKADCNAYDFATGLEWILNYHKNESNNTSMPMEMIKGATEYYEYTKSLSQEEGYALTAGEGSKFLEMVGIEVPDSLTVIYHCLAEKPYFYTLASYPALYPLSQALVDELTPEGIKSMDNKSMWYNGAYLMTTYIAGNEKVFEPNPEYWNKDAKRFNTATVRMVESTDVAFQLFVNGEIDYVDLTESNIKTINDDPSHPMYDYMVPAWPSAYSYQMHFNYQKMKEDGTEDTNWNKAVANENFRKSIYYGLELTEFLKRQNALEPLKCENNCFTKNMLVYTSDGRDYVDLVKANLALGESDGTHPVRWDADKAAEYKAQAIEELSAEGVTFPVEMDYYIAGSNQTALDTANVLKQTFSNSLGDDYIVLNIKTYVSSLVKEVRDPQLHSIVINGWGADYSDPQNFLGQLTYQSANAYYANYYYNINKVEAAPENQDLIDTFVEFTNMVADADTITKDMDARYAAYADAEAYALDHALVIPMYYQIGWCLTNYNVHGIDGTNKMVNWETNKNGYTREAMAKIIEEQNS